MNGMTYVKEPVAENPYLYDFYRDMPRWAFPMQMHLLVKMFQGQHEIRDINESFIFDRGIVGNKVFATMLHGNGSITDREYDTYKTTYSTLMSLLKKPDKIIFLDGTPEQAYERLQTRGRTQEEVVPLSYLKILQRYYDIVFFSKDRDSFLHGIELIRIEWTDGLHLLPEMSLGDLEKMSCVEVML